jgi:ribosome-interacting GTPase 1
VVVPYVRSKTTKEQRENAYVLVTLAVRAAEQIFFGAGKGEEKKKYVLEYLEKRGIKLTKEDLEVMIEAAVKELKLLEETVLQ